MQGTGAKKMGKSCSMKSTGQLGNTFLPRLISNYSRLATNPNTPTLPLYHRCGKVTNGNPTISCTIPYHILPYCTKKYHHIPNPHDGDIVVKTNPLSDGPTIFYQDVIQTSFFRINKWEIAICCKRLRKRGRLLFLFFTVMFESTILPARARLGEVIWKQIDYCSVF